MDLGEPWRPHTLHRKHTWYRGTGINLRGASGKLPAQPSTTWQPAAVQRKEARNIAQVTVDLKIHTSRLSPSAMGSVLHPSETSLRVRKKHLCELCFLFRVALVSSESHAVLHVWAQRPSFFLILTQIEKLLSHHVIRPTLPRTHLIHTGK